ncbi:electron transfer flavoprotein alpha subunit [Candidatus Kinetoplastibacterium desouzaii TCC079E]|uniref:Electron transfer flavoprotein subunit alpha n=1 Tax=Candidatus Kinetoplastidibacterium desouzai TCC079E TaxID=1208919 RepID=M1LS48_9PROT|nr:FAD-binding protein [Candidatus Kinetoplastibacterium desouzaii]AGF46971.1 electron transfer flavoprotein alpha subunit [Candidatus Kinetoplastibacterium desouzaii TCC079E]
MILIIPDHDNESLNDSIYNLISASLEFELEIHVLIVGYKVDNVVMKASLIPHVSRVLVSDAECFKDFLSEDISLQISSVANRYTHLIFSDSLISKSIAPRVAAILDIAPISEIIKVISNNIFIRTNYAGSIISTIEVKDRINIITIRTSSFLPKYDNCKIIPSVIETLESIDSNKLSKYITRNDLLGNRPDLSKARIIVAGGRAIASKENFENLLGVLADKMGAALGASRAAVDAGYASNELQIGQTGKSVSPRLYFAIGISGAAQHVAGMVNSEIVVAINNDIDAPIFNFADYGIVGDLFKIVPQLIKSL